MHHRQSFFSSLLVLLLGSSSLTAQQAFQTALPGVVPAAKRPAVQTPDGGFCVLTRFQDGENWYFVLVKIAPDGSPVWSRRYATPALNDHPVSLCTTSDGGFIAVGNTSAPNSNDQDVLALRLDKEGQIVWSRTYNFSPLDWASDITLLKDGSAVIVGSTTFADTAAASADQNFSPKEKRAAVERHTQERTLAFRIDTKGDVVWGGVIRASSTEPNTPSFTKGFAQGICTRSKNSVTLISQETAEYSLWSSLAVTITDRGEVSSGLGMLSAGTNARPTLATFANDLTSLPDGSCLVAGIYRYYTPELNAVDQGFLLGLDRENRILWNKTVTPEGNENSLPLSVAPLDDGRIMLAGRTLFNDRHYPESDNPVIAIADKQGKPISGTEWITSVAGLPIALPDDPPIRPFLWWPRFIPTREKGVFAAGEIMFGAVGDYAFEVTLPLTLLTRFGSNLATCNDTTRRIALHASLPGEEYTGSDLVHRGDWNPTDITSNDYRITSDVPPASNSNEGMNRNEQEEELPTDEGDYEDQSNGNPPDPAREAGEPKNKENEDLKGWLPDGPGEWSDEAPTTNREEEDENEPQEAPVPRFTTMNVLLLPLKIRSKVLDNVSTEDAGITPWILCNEENVIETLPAR